MMAMAKAELNALAALTQARNLIADPECWTRSAPARAWRAPRKKGAGQWIPVAATDPAARCWCAVGALCKVAGVRSGAPGFSFLDAAAVRLFGVGLGRANDDPRLGHADVLRCYDAAIAAAQAEAGRVRAA